MSALDRGSGTTTGTDLTCHIRSRRSANTLNVSYTVESDPHSSGQVRGTILRGSGVQFPFLSPPVSDIPIYLAGVNRRMIELAGSHADGLILGLLNSVAYLRDTVLPNLKKGLAKRDGGGCELCLPRICSVNADRSRALDLARHAIAFYSVLPYLRHCARAFGFRR